MLTRQPQWVIRSLALRHLQPEVLYSPDPAAIFSGVVICCARLSAHDAELLSAAVVALGGAYKLTLCEEVTHLIAVSRDSAKVRALEAHPHVDIPIVAPNWISDSFSLARKLPLDAYRFPAGSDALPACLLPSWERPSAAPEPHAPPPRAGDPDILVGKTLLLARDVRGGTLESQPQLHPLEERISAAGGDPSPPLPPGATRAQIASAVRAADIVIVRHRESEEFQMVCRAQHGWR